MRNIAARYEVVIDLTRPVESASLFEIVTGIRPVFDLRYNERTTDANSPLLRELRKIDTSHKSCGNELVHDTLKQQFNIIKDRLLQNRCFDEMTGSYELCERAKLAGGEVIERTRKESFQERQRLERIK